MSAPEKFARLVISKDDPNYQFLKEYYESAPRKQELIYSAFLMSAKINHDFPVLQSFFELQKDNPPGSFPEDKLIEWIELMSKAQNLLGETKKESTATSVSSARQTPPNFKADIKSSFLSLTNKTSKNN